MPTPEEIENVLTKVTTYQAARATSDTAQAAAQRAYADLGSRQTLWDTAIAKGETDEEKLTTLLTEMLAASTHAESVSATAQAASQASSNANSAISNAIDSILHPPAP